jgi:hypothetical protein
MKAVAKQRTHSADFSAPAIFDRYVFALDIAAVFQAVAKCARRSAFVSGDVESRNPTTGIAACCSRTSISPALLVTRPRLTAAHCPAKFFALL